MSLLTAEMVHLWGNLVSTSFQCSIITPEATPFDGEVIYVRFPAWDGLYGMMAGLSPMLSRLAPGGLRLDHPDGQSEWYLIEGGFAHVTGDQLTVLAESSTPASEIDLESAEQQLAAVAGLEPSDDMDRDEITRRQQVARERVQLARQTAGFTADR